MSLYKILITGVNGYIGKSLFYALKDEYEVTAITRKEVELTNSLLVNEFFNKHGFFDVVIHCAAVGGSRLKKDDWSIFYNNITMFYNLLRNQNKFNQLINFGSGTELNNPIDPYGLSKDVINRILQSESKINNIRIFAVFDENELDTRFIKSNINRYINKKPLIIHQNKLMDFFYMKDLINVTKYIIQNSFIKSIDCSYSQLYSLLDIANFINTLSNYKCDIVVKNNKLDSSYIGTYKNINIPLIGLKKGIEETYNKLNN